MEQLIQAFGVDVKLITVQVINFVVLLAILSYFLYRPILKLLADRAETVAQGIKDAEAAAAAKAAADEEKQAILTEAHHEAEAVAARAKASADHRAEEIVADAEQKAAATLQQAETQREEIKDQAHKESEAEVAKVAMLAAEKILNERST